jgi:hypothetical protein
VKWAFSIQWEWRRRAVVGGRAILEPDRAPLSADDLWLQEAAGVRRYRSHVREGLSSFSMSFPDAMG